MLFFITSAVWLEEKKSSMLAIHINFNYWVRAAILTDNGHVILVSK